MTLIEKLAKTGTSSIRGCFVISLSVASDFRAPHHYRSTLYVVYVFQLLNNFGQRRMESVATTANIVMPFLLEFGILLLLLLQFFKCLPLCIHSPPPLTPISPTLTHSSHLVLQSCLFLVFQCIHTLNACFHM